MIPPNGSLVKYDSPLQVNKYSMGDATSAEKPSKIKSLKDVTVRKPGTPRDRQTEELLNLIFPPRNWVEDSGLAMTQHVSTDPATVLDVQILKSELEKRLLQKQAREAGICPIRRELYTQCFDELIRQLTVSSAERGLLLFRVREELRMTLEVYQALYVSSVAYGMRKALKAEAQQEHCEKRVAELTAEKEELQRQVEELENKCQQVEASAEADRKAGSEQHQREMEVLRRENRNGKSTLEDVVVSFK